MQHWAATWWPPSKHGDIDMPTHYDRDVLIRELEVFFAARDDVEAAAIFGSVARSQERPDSDVDVLVAGAASELRINAQLRPLARQIGRPINASVFEVDQLRQLVESDEVIRAIINGTLIPLKGTLPSPRG